MLQRFLQSAKAYAPISFNDSGNNTLVKPEFLKTPSDIFSTYEGTIIYVLSPLYSVKTLLLITKSYFAESDTVGLIRLVDILKTVSQNVHFTKSDLGFSVIAAPQLGHLTVRVSIRYNFQPLQEAWYIRCSIF